MKRSAGETIIESFALHSPSVYFSTVTPVAKTSSSGTVMRYEYCGENYSSQIL